MKAIVQTALLIFLMISPKSLQAADGVSYAFLVAIAGYDTNELAKLPYTVS